MHGNLGLGSCSCWFFDANVVLHFMGVIKMYTAVKLFSAAIKLIPESMKYETDIYGKEVMNVIACEGLERVEGQRLTSSGMLEH
ncbi:hypothetical protein RHGRI_026763 [Rhododendron griersonianum]|uniref:Uncharacterized protein n=1 Tax=Rhododendron griersonianum TaxID=479676 RepID=A0AAV6IW93_9ERIC|nr:hypothetical protein RHGRI_026763 [Rhododendron griersonianum]